MDLKFRNILMMLVPTTILSLSYFWWKHKMLKFKGLKNTAESVEFTQNSETEECTAVKEEVVEEICIVEKKPVDFVEVDTFDDSLTLREFNHSSKRKREHSSCDADSAFVEDFSSDNLSMSGSDSNNSNKTPMHDPAVCIEVVVPESKDCENVSNNNIRDWFGPALETDSQDKYANIISWGSQPASDFEGDFTDKSEHESIEVVIPLENLSIVLEKEYNDRKAKFATKKKEQSKHNKTPKKSHKSSPKKSPRTPKKRSTDSPKTTNTPKHRRTPKHKEERNLDKPWREHSVESISHSIEVDTYPIYPNDYAVLEYLIPDDLCGKVIGKHGKAVKDINEKTGAYVCIETEKIDNRCVLSISGLLSQAQEAEQVLLTKFKSSLQKYSANMPLDPKVENICLKCNESVNVIVTAVINAGNLSLQIFNNDVDGKLVKLQNDINNSYSTPPQRVFYHESRRPKIGEVCISFIDSMWCRVQVQEYFDDSQVVVLFIDYGGNVVVPWQMLYKIRKEFLDIPAQAIQCHMAEVFPLTGQDDFSYSANLTFNQLVEGKVLRAYVHSVYEDVPCVELFYTNEETSLETSINRNLIEWGLVSSVVISTILEGAAENVVVMQSPVESEDVVSEQ